jgi:tetratricopeptide (TPR) repeat protein
MRVRILAAAAALLAAPAVHAGAPLRWAVVAEVRGEDGALLETGFDALLAEPLVRAGRRLVDPESMKRLRAFVSVPEASAGTLPAGVSGLDAELVLSANARCKTRREAGLEKAVQEKTGGQGVFVSANCTVEIGLVRADTGELLGKFSLGSPGAAAYDHEAVRRSLERIGKAFEAENLKALLARADEPRPVAVWLFASPDRRFAEGVTAALGKVAGASGAVLRDFSPEVTRIEVVHEGGGQALARALEERPALELRVERASAGLLSLRRDPAHALRLPMRIEAVEADQKLALATKDAAERLELFLANSGFLVPVAESERAQLLVFVYGRREADGAVGFEVRARAVGKKDVLLEAHAHSETALAEVARDIARRLPAALSKRREPEFAPFKGAEKRFSEARAASPLEVGPVDAVELFPAASGAYSEAPIATAQVTSRSGRPLTGVVARASLRGFSGAPRFSPPIRIEARGQAKLALHASLDGTRLLGVVTAISVPLEVEILWREGEAERSESFSVPVKVHEKNAIDWRDAASAAAFVNPRDPAVRALVEKAAGSAGASDLPRAVVRAVEIVEALRLRGPRYIPDPVVPFGKAPIDFVAYPAETLKSGTGDCDDLSVLLASALEASGLSTQLVLPPGHVLVALDTGLPASLAGLVSADPGAIVEREGRGLLPLEATALAEGFAVAWKKGAEELRRHKPEEVSWVAVRRAWEKHPPASVTGPAAEGYAPGGAKAVVLALATEQKAALRRALERTSSPREKALWLALQGNAAEAAKAAAGEDPATLCVKGDALLLDGDAKGALAAFEGALGKAPPAALGAGLWRNVAVVRRLGGDEAGAAGALASALKLDRSVASDLDEPAGRAAEQEDRAVLRAELLKVLARARREADAQKKGAPLPAESGKPSPIPWVTGGRRGVDPDERIPLAAALYWPPMGAR